MSLIFEYNLRILNFDQDLSKLIKRKKWKGPIIVIDIISFGGKQGCFVKPSDTTRINM